jgi:hypothetical protein
VQVPDREKKTQPDRLCNSQKEMNAVNILTCGGAEGERIWHAAADKRDKGA